MNPLDLIRWRVLLALAVVIGLLYFLGLNPLAERGVRDLKTGAKGVRWDAGRFGVNPLAGELDVRSLVLAVAEGGADGREAAEDRYERAMSAEILRFDMAMNQLLRKRVYGEMQLTAPIIRLQRSAGDGTVSPGDGDRPRGIPEDWVETALRWVERIRDLREKIPGEGIPGTGRKEESARVIDYGPRVSYPFRETARFAVTRLLGEGLEIHFEDAPAAGGDGSGIPPIQDGRIEVTGLSSNPAHYPEPVEWRIAGRIGDSPIEAGGKVDLRADKAADAGMPGDEVAFEVSVRGLPLAVVSRFAGDSLPVRFESGRVTARATVSIRDFHELDIRPVLHLSEAVSSPREGVGSILGVDAARFCSTLNEVGEIRIEDIRISGTVENPSVSMGDTLKTLMVAGAESFAREKANEALGEGMKKVDEALEGAGGEQLEGAREGLKGTLEKGIGEGLGGLFKRDSGKSE